MSKNIHLDFDFESCGSEACNDNSLPLSFSDEQNNSSTVNKLSADLDSNSEDISDILNNIRKENIDRLIVAHLNINSIRNKFELLVDSISGKVDILMLSETKLDASFPRGQFFIKGYTNPYRLDRTANGGGILLYIREDIPSTLVNFPGATGDIENLFVEINLRKKKWLLGCCYNPHKRMISSFLDIMKKRLNYHSSKYENFLIMGDFNSETKEKDMLEFCELYHLCNLIKEPTCFKNPINPSCIDLLLTNKKMCFQNSKALETNLSDFHKMTLTVLKAYYKKSKPTKITYRNYKNFNNEAFRNIVVEQMAKLCEGTADCSIMKNFVIATLDRLAPKKTKYVRANEKPFMNKIMRKAIMRRSYLRNKFLREKTTINREAYKKQRNYCVSLLRNVKSEYFNSLNMNKITDNKAFWKTIGPYFREKSNESSKTTLKEEEKIVSNPEVTCNIFNDFFSNIVKNLDLNIDKGLLIDYPVI